MAQVFGEDQKEIRISVNGNKEKHKDMGFIHGLMEIVMKDNSRTALSTEKELKDFSMEIPIKVSIKTGSLQVMESIIGLQAVFSKGISKMG